MEWYQRSHSVGVNFLPVTTNGGYFYVLLACCILSPFFDLFLFNRTPYLDHVHPMYFSTCVSA
jgi:hypothetical protein